MDLKMQCKIKKSKKKEFKLVQIGYGEAFLSLVPKYNPNSIIYLDLLSKELNILIQHALNVGEKKFQRCFIDGYIEEYNICIEWDEKYHDRIKQKEKDIKRDNFLTEQFKCKIIRINQEEFLKDIENNLLKISKEILDYIDY